MTTTIDWETLLHAHGPATRVPATLKKLLGKQEQARVDAFDSLRDSLPGTQQWFSASAPAALWLIQEAKKAPEPDLLLVLAADIIGADHVRGWLMPADASIPAEAEQVTQDAVGQVAALKALLASKDARARAAAPVVMAMLPSVAQDCLPLLVARIETDPDEVVRASAMLAVGKIASDERAVKEAIAAMSSSTSALLRGTATLVRLRQDPSLEFAAVADGVFDWLKTQPALRDRTPWLPWFGGLQVAWYTMNQKLDASAHVLMALAKARGQEAALVSTCLQLGAREALGLAARRLGGIILEGSGFSARPKAAVVPFDELSEGERRVAESLATTTLLPVAGYGLPSAGNSRRRWASLMPPGPLEKPVKCTLAGQERTVPFWFAVRELNAAKAELPDKGEGPFPKPIAGAVSGAERWQAVAELVCANYLTNCALVSRFDEEFAAITLNDAVLALAASAADDLLARVEAARRDDVAVTPSNLAVAWLLLPFVRTKTPLEARWDILIEIGKDVRVRKIFEALPRERREQRLLDYLDPNCNVMYLVSVFERGLGYLPLSPTSSVVKALLTVLERHAAQPDHRAPELRAKLDALAAKDEGVRAALLEASRP